MSFEMNRRTLLQVAGGTAALAAVGSVGRLVSAQDAWPAATAVDAGGVLNTWTDGPGADEVTVTHQQGETVIPKNPERIVSFEAASIETIDFLGGTLAGIPEISGLEISQSPENVGSLFEPDYEAVNAIAPDLIIVSGRSAGVLPDLDKIGPTIDLSFDYADFVGSYAANSALLGTLVNNSAAADEAVAAATTRVEALQATAATAGTALVVLASGGALNALAPGDARAGRGALIYQTLGMQLPLEDLEGATHGEPISFEFLLEHNPDWLFVIDRDKATGGEADAQPAEELLDNEIVKQTKAYLDNHIVYLNPFDWYMITGASIPSMDRMLTDLETAFAQ